MSTVTLIRHGQAAAFTDDYDRLTPLGMEQCELLRAHWIQNGTAFDEIHSGTLRRQVHSAEIVFGTATTNPQWNEYDGDALVGTLAPLHAETDPETRRLIDDFEANLDTPERKRCFQRLFERIAAAWYHGHVEHPEVETWAQFEQRVKQAFHGIVASGPKRNIAVVTSGGPIGVAITHVLHASGEKAIEVNWRVRNCSITRFIFGPDRVTLDEFNSTPHLREERLRTFR